MPNTAQDGDPHWLAQAAAIRSALNLKPSADIALMGTSSIANLAVGSTALPTPPTVAQAGYQIAQISDALVTSAAIYTKTEYSFFHAYALYLDGLNPKGAKNPSPTDTAQLKSYRKEVNIGLANYEKAIEQAGAAWKAAEDLTPGTYPDFTDFLDATNWGPKIKALSAAVDLANAQITSIMQKVYGANYTLIDKMRTAVDLVRKSLTGSQANWPNSMQVKAASGKLVVPSVAAFTPLPRQKIAKQNYKSFTKWVDTAILNHVAGRPKHVVPLVPPKQRMLPKLATEPTPFFGTSLDLGTGAPQANTLLKQLDKLAEGPATFARKPLGLAGSKTLATFGYDAITLLPVTRGDWYDPSLLYAFQNPEDRKLITGLIIAMYPTISVQMDKAAIKSVLSAYNSSAGVMIGSQQARAGADAASGNPDFATLSVKGNTVSISSENPEPILIGVQLSDIETGT